MSERPEYAAGMADVGSACRICEGSHVTTEADDRIRWIKVVHIKILWQLYILAVLNL
jgi:hypothetical protein